MESLTSYTDRDVWLLCPDPQLLDQCDVHVYKASGPGGQHRNKVSSAVRLKHRASGVSAHGDDSRSQHENKRLAIKRLRMNISCQIRCELSPDGILPDVVRECLHVPKKRTSKEQTAELRLDVGRKDYRFWPVAAFVMDLLDAHQGRLGEVATALGVSTGNVSAFLKSERHLFAAAQHIRSNHGQKPLK